MFNSAVEGRAHAYNMAWYPYQLKVEGDDGATPLKHCVSIYCQSAHLMAIGLDGWNHSETARGVCVSLYSTKSEIEVYKMVSRENGIGSSKRMGGTTVSDTSVHRDTAKAVSTIPIATRWVRYFTHSLSRAARELKSSAERVVRPFLPSFRIVFRVGGNIEIGRGAIEGCHSLLMFHSNRGRSHA